MISEKIKQIKACPECGGTIIYIQESGDILCSQCGIVLDERSIDFAHSGRRAFTLLEKNQRESTGAPISRLLPDMGFTTVIDNKNIINPDLKRAAKWDTRISWQKRNLLIATTELKRICTNLNLPDYIKVEAMHLYRRAFEKKLLKGRSINGMIAACIYFAIRTLKLPRTLQEVIDEASVEAKEVRRCYSALIRELELKVPNTDPGALVPKFIVEMGLDAEVEKITLELLKAFKSNLNTSGKDPKGIVAGALYLACRIKDKKVTQNQIAKTIGVTEVTLRSRYKELTKKLNLKNI